jgi:mannose-6-phosphate isomerase
VIAAFVLDKYRKICEEAKLEFELDQRPWGGEFIFDPERLDAFIEEFFPGEIIEQRGELAHPKLLLVGPGERFSWQYHERRGEVWRVLSGPVGLIHGTSNDQPPVETLDVGDMVTVEPGERHRLVGLGDWGVVAELWRHNDAARPSDEADNTRLADDYGRS